MRAIILLYDAYNIYLTVKVENYIGSQLASSNRNGEAIRHCRRLIVLCMYAARGAQLDATAHYHDNKVSKGKRSARVPRV